MTPTEEQRRCAYEACVKGGLLPEGARANRLYHDECRRLAHQAKLDGGLPHNAGRNFWRGLRERAAAGVRRPASGAHRARARTA